MFADALILFNLGHITFLMTVEPPRQLYFFPHIDGLNCAKLEEVKMHNVL